MNHGNWICHAQCRTSYTGWVLAAALSSHSPTQPNCTRAHLTRGIQQCTCSPSHSYSRTQTWSALGKVYTLLVRRPPCTCPPRMQRTCGRQAPCTQHCTCSPSHCRLKVGRLTQRDKTYTHPIHSLPYICLPHMQHTSNRQALYTQHYTCSPSSCRSLALRLNLMGTTSTCSCSSTRKCRLDSQGTRLRLFYSRECLHRTSSKVLLCLPCNFHACMVRT